jgi:hypothetical protein
MGFIGKAREAQRLSLAEVAQQVQSVAYNGLEYVVPTSVGSMGKEPIVPVGEGVAIASNGFVMGLVMSRITLFAQTRFAWMRQGSNSNPVAANRFTDTSLKPLDNPAALLTRAEMDVAEAGNAFMVMGSNGKIRNLIPRFVNIIIGLDASPEEVAKSGGAFAQHWDSEVIGYIYEAPGMDAEFFAADEVGHYYYMLDPLARYRGMSYLRPVLKDVDVMNAETRYAIRYFENAATPNMALVFPSETSPQTIKLFADQFRPEYEGADRAFRTAFIGGGADVKLLGTSLKDLAMVDLNATEFAKLCAASGVPPMVATVVPGLEAAASYANYPQALRRFADFTVRYMWEMFTREVEKLLTRPPGAARLVIDISGVSALQADMLDEASVVQTKINSINNAVNSGFTPESAVAAVDNGDLTKLVHTGFVSVQLIPPGMTSADASGKPDDPADDNNPNANKPANEQDAKPVEDQA